MHNRNLPFTTIMDTLGLDIGTHTHDDVYRAIGYHMLMTGYPPSIRDVSDISGLSPARVLRALDKLEDRGWLYREIATSRGMVVRVGD